LAPPTLPQPDGGFDRPAGVRRRRPRRAGPQAPGGRRHPRAVSRLPGLRWDCWPDRDDRLLLRAIVHPDDAEARAAWTAVHPDLDLDAPTQEQIGSASCRERGETAG